MLACVLMTEIVQKENPVLRKTAKEVALEDIGSDKINKTLSDMFSALEKCEDGVALAAPQIGVPLRIFIISPRAFLVGQHNEVPEKTGKKTRKEAEKLVYINPVIIKRSARKITLDEGCLSVKNVFGKIKRHQKITITAYDEHGNKFTRGAAGLIAEIFQHETDHLNGILFLDSATNLITITQKHTQNVK